MMNTEFTDLQPGKAALATRTDAELRALVDATDEVPQIATGLLEWIDSACHWELSRREGRIPP